MAMRSSSPTGGPSGDGAEPLLGAEGDDRGRRFRVRPTLRGAAQFLRRASSRRMMREPSMLVRETAAEQLEERRSDWAYSRPVVVLDLLWNLAFVTVAVTVLVISRYESPSMPLRLWIAGYALQCILHMVCVCMEYKRRQVQEPSSPDENETNHGDSGSSTPRGAEEVDLYDPEQAQDERARYGSKRRLDGNRWNMFFCCIVGYYSLNYNPLFDFSGGEGS